MQPTLSWFAEHHRMNCKNLPVGWPCTAERDGGCMDLLGVWGWPRPRCLHPLGEYCHARDQNGHSVHTFTKTSDLSSPRAVTITEIGKQKATHPAGVNHPINCQELAGLCTRQGARGGMQRELRAATRLPHKSGLQQ